MSKEVIPIILRSVLPTSNGCALFLGNQEKTFVIYVDQSVGVVLNMALNNENRERPLTHDLMNSLLLGLDATVERVVINDAREGTFFARLIVQMKNEVDTKLIELDARPSDSITLAVLQEAPIFVARKVWEEVEDMTTVLAQILVQQNEDGPDLDEEEDDDENDDDDSPF